MPPPVPSRTTERVGRVATVSTVLPLRLPDVAVIVVDPAPRAVANPFASMVATVVSLLVHVTPPIPSTATGVNAQDGLFVQACVRGSVSATPTRPKLLFPQQRTVPS